MKYFILIILIFNLQYLIAQDYFNTEKEALAKFPQKDVYQCNSGWLLHKGDDINLGHGSMPDKSFAFIKTASNGLITTMAALKPGSMDEIGSAKLDFSYNNKKAVIKDFVIYGSKKTGFYVIARLKVGGLRQDLFIENAIEAGEIKVPEQYAVKKVDQSSQLVSSKADEIKKLKELLDSGALTQDEFNSEKKKILDK